MYYYYYILYYNMTKPYMFMRRRIGLLMRNSYFVRQIIHLKIRFTNGPQYIIKYNNIIFATFDIQLKK